MFRLIPRETKFFELFAELSTSLTAGAKLLHAILEDPHDLKERVKQMQAIEHEGDRATHAIIAKLNTSFITPFDREDIHRLASSLDDVLDFVNAAAVRLVMYKIAQPPRQRLNWLESSCSRPKNSLKGFRCSKRTMVFLNTATK
jgi:uncharacterized protein Yka (UPF0111/DUF47 family)